MMLVRGPLIGASFFYGDEMLLLDSNPHNSIDGSANKVHVVDVEPGTYDVMQPDGTYKKVEAAMGRLDVPILDTCDHVNIVSKGLYHFGLFKEHKKHK